MKSHSFIKACTTKLSALVFVMSLLAALSSTLMIPDQVEAFAGRSEYHGYFTNGQDTMGQRLENSGIGASNINDFVNFYKSRVNGSGKGYTIAAFTILNMLGEPPGTAKSQARTRFAEWESLVRSYDSANRINWSKSVTFTKNTFYQDSKDDVAWYNESDTQASIVFTMPSGATYSIKRNCANPVGDMGPLEPLGYKVQGARVYPGGTFASGEGWTGVSGHTTKTDNPFVYNNVSGTVTVTSSSGIVKNGFTYKLVAYSFCADNTTCHSTSRRTGTSFTLPDKTGGYYDLKLYYEPEGGSTPTGETIASRDFQSGAAITGIDFNVKVGGTDFGTRTTETTIDSSLSTSSYTLTADTAQIDSKGYKFVRWVFPDNTSSTNTSVTFGVSKYDNQKIFIELEPKPTGAAERIVSGIGSDCSSRVPGAVFHVATGDTLATAGQYDNGTRTTEVDINTSRAFYKLTFQTAPAGYSFVAWRFPDGGGGTSTSYAFESNEYDNQTICIELKQNTTAGGCPSMLDPNVTIALPDRSPINNGAPSDTTVPNNYYTETQRKNQTKVTGTEDISNNLGVDYPKKVGSPAFRLPLISESYQSATISYQPFIDQCPYDRNQGQVLYDSYYQERTWKSSSSPDYYTCPSGGSLSGSTCTVTYSWTHWHSCPTTTDPNKQCPHTHYSSYTYSATAWYRHSAITGWSDKTATGTADGPVMQPCWHRTYNATASLGQPALNSDLESPTTSTLSSAAVNVAFNVEYPEKGDSLMRKASRINGLPYRIDYSVNGGSWTNATAGTVNVVAGNTQKSSSGSAPVAGSSVSVSVSPPHPPATLNLAVGDRVCWRITVGSPNQNIVDVDGNHKSGSGSYSTQACTAPVVNWPYLKVYGNDVMAGGAFGSGCGTNAGIRVRNRGFSKVGSSTQYAAFATGVIDGFGSANLKTSAPLPHIGLSFSNQTGGFGGSYSGNDGSTCLPDYFGSQPQSAQSTTSVKTTLETPNSDPRKVEFYQTGGSTAIGSVVNVPNRSKKVIYVNGTLTINQNVIASTSGWSNAQDVPFVMIIARDVVIASGVTRLDGVYVAQPGNGGSGVISTCQTLDFYTCQQPLTVNGTLIAERINFLRTRGSLRDSVNFEGRSSAACSPRSGTATQVDAYPGNSCAAEVINFAPELYLALTVLLTPDQTFKVDSLVTLPPNL